MPMISQVMTRDVRVIAPRESVQRAAQLMDELNVGSLPVCDGQRLVGMVTDRDITVRATAAGLAPGEAHVDDVMSTDVRWCFEDEDVDQVVRQMGDTQIRRVPVVSHDDQRRLIGIVALGDLLGRDAQQAASAAARVSTPSAPDRPQRGTARQAGTGYDPRVSGITAEGGNPHAGEVTGSRGTSPSAYAAGSEVGGDLGEAADEEGIQAAGGPGKVAKNSAEVERPEDDRNTGGMSGASGGTAATGGSAGSRGGARP